MIILFSRFFLNIPGLQSALQITPHNDVCFFPRKDAHVIFLKMSDMFSLFPMPFAHPLSNTAGAEFAELLGLKTVSRGVKVQFVDDSKIIVDAIITVLYGCNIVGVARSVQEKLMTLVQSTTGIDNAEINVHVSGVAFEK